MKKCCIVLLLLVTSSITFPMCNVYKILDLVTKDFTLEEKKNCSICIKTLEANKPTTIGQKNNQKQEDRRSFDEIIDDYEPCTLLLKNGFVKLVDICKDVYRTAALLNRALNASEVKEKED